MKKVSLFDYYSFGFNYFILMNNSSDSTVELFARDITSYIAFIKKLDLKVTMSLLKMDKWQENLDLLDKLNKGVKKKKIIDEKLHTEIITIIKKADPTLDAELNIKMGYLINEKRISTDKLIEEISSIFSKDTFLHLPDIARFDFAESGKCIAYERNTASAFHSLRGTEDTLKFYYTSLTGKTATETQTWWNFHNEIEKEITNNNITPHPPKELMQNLDSLRIFYRNKTQHPQLIYTSDEAQDLLFNCIKSVNEMIKDLKARLIINDLPF